MGRAWSGGCRKLPAVREVGQLKQLKGELALYRLVLGRRGKGTCWGF